MSAWVELKALAQDLTLLVVDDDPEVLQQLQQLLGQVFGKVLVAANGEEAWAVYCQVAPKGLDLLVSDIRMPHKDGLELARAIRDRDTEIKILLVSAYNEASYFLQALEIGVDGFLVKPVHPAPLLQTLSKLCRNIQDHKARLEYQQRLEEERLLVASLMQGMLKHPGLEDPAIEWLLEPSEMIGGDLVAVERHAASGHLYALLADSTGHGLPAATHLLPLHRIFYAMASKGYALSSLLVEINRVLYEYSPGDRFVAATLLMLDPRDGLLEIWNGGNPVALLLTEAGQVRAEFKSQHLPLGVLGEDFDSATQRFFCQPGDQLLLFSDGILDAESPTGEHWGGARLLQAYQALPPHARGLQALKQAVELHLDGAKAGDDFSLLRINISPNLRGTSQ